MQEQHTKYKDKTTYVINFKMYIESNPDGMFMNESNIAEFVQLYRGSTDATYCTISLESLRSKGWWKTH